MSTPSGKSPVRWGRRTSALTFHPWARNARATWLPTNPVPPVKNRRIVRTTIQKVEEMREAIVTARDRGVESTGVMSRPDRSVRLFDNAVLDGLSSVHPVVPALVWGPLALLLYWRSFAIHQLGGWEAALLAAGGLLAWSFTEYALHRFVFHLTPITPRRRRLQFLVHGVHHEYPDDPRRLLMPLAPAAVVAAVLYGLFRMALGPAWVDLFFASLLVGYLAYDYTHLAIHRGHRRTRLGRSLRRYHMRHHFVTPDARWGVTSPLWDWIFRTTGQPCVSQNQRAVAG